MLGNSRLPFGPGISRTPSPFALAKVGNTQESPYSYTGRTSRDGLISAALETSPTPDVPPVPPPHQSKFPNPRALLRKPVLMQRTTSIESFSRSGAEQDTDALMVEESFRAHRASVLPSFNRSRVDTLKKETTIKQKGSSAASLSSTNSVNTPSVSSTSNSSLETEQMPKTLKQATSTTRMGQTNGSISSSATRRATDETFPIDGEEDDQLFGDTDSIKDDALLALNLSESRDMSKDDEPKKVYTVAQFQILKRHEMSNNKPDEDVNGDDYDDDEDDEVTQAQKRRLQEHKDAQHKIWRQRMSKAIGDQSTNVPGRPSFHAGYHSSPNLFSKQSPKVPGSDAGGSSSDDEDIPLGVLQAHGFPSKNRPPDARHSANSFVGVTRPGSAVGSIPRPGSPGGSRSVAGGPRGTLPPFARKLPQDPYFGASDLVTPANRESLGFASQRPASVYTPTGAAPAPNMPNGLVGVIAEEERQRSMRRGSPNQPGLRQSTYMPPMPPQMGMPIPGMPMNPAMMMMQMPGGGPEQQVFNQQMVQLLQQQTMMIQHLMSQNGGQGMQQTPSFVGVPATPQARPMSMAAGSLRPPNARTMSMVNIAPPMQPRTMSMINLQPNMGPNFSMDTVMPSGASTRGLGLQPNYAPSVAPSERSNVGQPSRYKPVQGSVLADGGSTITAVNTGQLSTAEKKKSFFSAIIHPAHRARGKENVPADEDDDDDWSNFAAKRRGQA